MFRCFPCAILLFLIVGTFVIISAFTSCTRERFKRVLREWWIVVAGFALMNAILLFSKYRSYLGKPSGVGQLGDFIGGYLGTLFALVSVVLLYRTLMSQRHLSKMTSFETKFYEMLKLHRENVTEMRIGELVGRRIFVMMLAELRQVHQIVSLFDDDAAPWSTEEKWHIAYYFFYFGVGPTSTPMVKHALQNYEPYVLQEIDLNLKQYAEDRHRLAEVGIEYVAFDGHQSRLGHYYRHLYQAVDYVHEQKWLGDRRKSYVKTIRAQLSTHEQALLLINSLTPFGNKWWDEKLITTYGMVKNLPPNFFTPQEIQTTLYFKPDYFEVNEQQARPKSRTLKARGEG